jgi:hypothetical protein
MLLAQQQRTILDQQPSPALQQILGQQQFAQQEHMLEHHFAAQQEQLAVTQQRLLQELRTMRPGSSLPNSEHRSPARPSQSGEHMQQPGRQPSRQGPPPTQRPQQQPYLPQQPSPLDLDHAIQQLQQLQRLQQQTQQQQTQQPARFVSQQDKIVNELITYHRRRALPPVHSPTTTMAVW